MSELRHNAIPDAPLGITVRGITVPQPCEGGTAVIYFERDTLWVGNIAHGL